MRPLNLASQPFRNERLPSLLVVLAALAVTGVSVRHAFALRGLLPGRTSALNQELAALEGERVSLRNEATRLRSTRPDGGALAHWAVLKELVDRRAFSWSGLFALLEEVLPQGIRLVSIAPSVSKKGQMQLDIAAVARSNEDALEFIRVLEDREEFADVLPRSRTGEQGTEFRYTMKYEPGPSPSPDPAAAAQEADADRPAATARPKPAEVPQ